MNVRKRICSKCEASDKEEVLERLELSNRNKMKRMNERTNIKRLICFYGVLHNLHAMYNIFSFSRSGKKNKEKKMR